MSVGSISSGSSYSYDAAVQTKKSTQVAVPTQAADTATKSTDASSFNTATKWGFKVDSNGFFGTDFNKAVGLPENMKIHQEMMNMADEYSKARGDNIDPLTMVSKVWNLYKTVAGNTLDPDGDGYMTQEEMDKMPKDYVSKGSVLDGIVSVDRGGQAESGENPFLNLWTAIPVFNTVHFTPNSGSRMFSGGMYDAVGCSKDYESYTNTPYEDKKDDGTISVGELFGSFFLSRVDMETQEIKPNPDGEHFYDTSGMNSVKATKAYYSFLDSGQDLKSYIEKTAGKDSYAKLVGRLGMKLDNGKFDGQTAKLDEGAFDQSIADKCFAELDKIIKNSLQDYTANNFPNLDPPKEADGTKSAKEDTNGTKESKSQKSPYSAAIQKLPSGSLISASA